MERLDPLLKEFADNHKIGYLMGKGSRKMVSSIITKDSWDASEILTDTQMRETIGTSVANPHVFATVKLNSSVDKHVSGWYVTSDICNQLKLQKKSHITATKNIHAVRTDYAALGLPEKEGDLFYQYMGHSRTTNEENYQCPLALREVLTVGRYIDNSECLLFLKNSLS